MSLFPYNPQQLLAAYSSGQFPTLNSQGAFFLFRPTSRALLPIEGMHVSRTLAQTIRKGTYRVCFDTDFDRVMECCVRPTENWITPELMRVYSAMHRQGWAHSVASYDQAGELAGGLYGLAIGSVFFVESMFSRKTDSSKVATAALVAECKSQGFRLIDVQLMSDHLLSLGAYSLPAGEFERQLSDAVEIPTQWGKTRATVAEGLLPLLLTKRLIIKPLAIDDAERWFEMNIDPEFAQYTLSPVPQSISEAKDAVGRSIRSVQSGTPDPLGIYLIDDPDLLVGTIGGFYPQRSLPQMELAFDIARPFWGLGYAPEACHAMIDFLFSTYPILRLQARCTDENVRSARVLQKAGFAYEGTLRSVMYFGSRAWDMRYFGITYSDWLQSRGTSSVRVQTSGSQEVETRA